MYSLNFKYHLMSQLKLQKIERKVSYKNVFQQAKP